MSSAACSVALDADILGDGVCAGDEVACRSFDGALQCLRPSPSNGCGGAVACSPCSLANAEAACDQGSCRIASCVPGWMNCNDNPEDGCEQDIFYNPMSCGNCPDSVEPCDVQHGVPGCSRGVCTVLECDDGYADCDGLASTGCEADLRTSTTHCGACKMGCGDGQTCTNGECA